MDVVDGAVMAGVSGGVMLAWRTVEKLWDRDRTLTTEMVETRFAALEKKIDEMAHKVDACERSSAHAAKLADEARAAMALPLFRIDTLDKTATDLHERVEGHRDRFSSLERKVLEQLQSVTSSVASLDGQVKTLINVVNAALREGRTTSGARLSSVEDIER